MQCPDMKGVEFVVLHVVEMSFLGFSKFWDTSECGEERKNTLQTRLAVCSDMYQPAVAHSCDMYQLVAAPVAVKQFVVAASKLH